MQWPGRIQSHWYPRLDHSTYVRGGSGPIFNHLLCTQNCTDQTDLHRCTPLIKWSLFFVVGFKMPCWQTQQSVLCSEVSNTPPPANQTFWLTREPVTSATFLPSQNKALFLKTSLFKTKPGFISQNEAPIQNKSNSFDQKTWDFKIHCSISLAKDNRVVTRGNITGYK